MSKIAVYAGTFDPITSGHTNIIERAVNIFDHLIIAIGNNAPKSVLFGIPERIDMIQRVCEPFSAKEIEVTSFDGLLIEFCRKRKAKVIVRGLRAAMDFEYELTIALANKTQAPEIETVFLPTKPEYSFVSSSVVKEIASHGGNVRHFCTPYVEQRLWDKLRSKPDGQTQPAR
jgi:pantetheine-phosphate adenylyltransferase